MNVKIFLTFIFYLHLVGSHEKEVDGSYTRMDKIKHLAELRPISERKFEYKFLDMIFEVIVDLPAHIHGLKPFLFCPEIIITLFLNDNNHNLYQCDAAGITSNTVTLICQQLDVKSVTCAERHEKYMPVFLKSSNGTIFQGSDSRNDNSIKIILIILLIVVVVVILPLLIWLIILQRKSIRIFNGNNNNDNNDPPQRAEVVYNQQNGVHIPLIQNGGNATGALQTEPPNNEIQLEINDSLVVRKQQLQNEKVVAKETPCVKNKNLSIQSLAKKVNDKEKSTSLLLDLANAIPVTSSTTVHAKNEQSKKHAVPENQFESFFKQPTNIKGQSSPSSPSENENLFEKGSSSSLEILSDIDEDEWVMDTKQKDKNLVYRMLSHNSSVKSRLSKLCGNGLFAKAAHVVILGKNDVIAFDTANKRLTKFPAAVDYSFYPPKIGVDYESSSVITPNITETNFKTSQLPIKECYTAHGIQQFYVIEIDKKERLIQAETVVIDLIRKAAKYGNPKDTVAFIYPAYLTEKQKNAYLHAAHNSDFWNLELVDEQLALGYSISKITKKYFVLVNCYETKAVVSMFRYETEKCRKMIELDEIEKSGKDIGQIVEVICFMMKERTHSEMPIYVARNKQIFGALKQHYFEDSLFTMKFIDNPEETLVKGESPNFLPLRYENITLNAEGDIKFNRSMSEKTQTLSELGPFYNSLYNSNNKIIQ